MALVARAQYLCVIHFSHRRPVQLYGRRNVARRTQVGGVWMCEALTFGDSAIVAVYAAAQHFGMVDPRGGAKGGGGVALYAQVARLNVG